MCFNVRVLRLSHDSTGKIHGAQDNWLEDAESKQPLGKLAKPDEVAELVALMLSDRGGVMCGSLIDYDQEIVGTSD